METTIPKKRGPLSQGYVDTHLRIEPDLLEFAKEQRGGFSAFVRKLVRDAYDRERRQQRPGS
jgi:hypothetical protein